MQAILECEISFKSKMKVPEKKKKPYFYYPLRQWNCFSNSPFLYKCTHKHVGKNANYANVLCHSKTLNMTYQTYQNTSAHRASFYRTSPTSTNNPHLQLFYSAWFFMSLSFSHSHQTGLGNDSAKVNRVNAVKQVNLSSGPFLETPNKWHAATQRHIYHDLHCMGI